jgi:DNA-binding CsgD family transcriptional regulator
MEMLRTGISDLRRFWRLSVLLGVVTPILSVMLGLFFHFTFYEIARNIPSIIRQDAHVSLPLCKIFPDLYGCEPWVGTSTSLQLLELSQQVGSISGLLLNLALLLIFSVLATIRLLDKRGVTGVIMGIVGVFSSLILALALRIPLNLKSPNGILGILLLLLLPLSGWAGGHIGQDRIARTVARRSVFFIPVDVSTKPGWVGESLSYRELEVLAMVAEGYKNREIAKRLYISESTVKTHLIHIYAKLGVKNRTTAVTQALAFGLIQKEEEKESQ